MNSIKISTKNTKKITKDVKFEEIKIEEIKTYSKSFSNWSEQMYDPQFKEYFKKEF